MPIEKGVDWGEPGSLAPNARVAASDSEAASLITDAEGAIGLSAGDLARTLGVRQPFDPARAQQLLPIDALEVELDGGATMLAVAHVLAGTWISGDMVAVMNAAFVGQRNLAPRAHPGDGSADIVHLELGVTDRFKAHQRMRTGTHVPHPDISIRRRSHGVVEFDRPRRVMIDGVARGRTSVISYRIRPEAFVVGV